MSGVGECEKLWKVYTKYRQELYSYALSITRNPSLAEDAIHSTFVAVAGKCGDVRNLRAYIFRTLRNTALEQIKAGKRHQSSEGIGPACSRVAPHEYDPGRRCLENEAGEQLDRALDEISFEQKETIVLRVYAGFKFREIAKLLNEPMATITSRYRRALKALAGKLKEYYDEN